MLKKGVKKKAPAAAEIQEGTDGKPVVEDLTRKQAKSPKGAKVNRKLKKAAGRVREAEKALAKAEARLAKTREKLAKALKKAEDRQA